MPEKIRIAICGGGIASLCLAHALTVKHRQWEVKVFEASAQLRDEGAAIGLGKNAQDALSLMSSDLREALAEAGGTSMKPSARIMMATGPDSGRHIGDINQEVATVVVHRGRFWRALAKRIPEGIFEMGKRLIAISSAEDAELATLTFEDGSSYQADAIVGCDGINSVVRKTILGEGHPATAPVYTDGYNHRVVISLDQAKKAFGEAYCIQRTQHGWVGENGFCLTDFIDNGKSMQVVAGWNRGEPWPYEAPFVEWSKDRFRKDIEEWDVIRKAMTQVFTGAPKLFAAGSRVHLETPTYCRGPMCVAGDAAQCFLPFQGAGAGQAIEDALMLSTTLGAVSTRREIPMAFATYDALRRPRRADIAKSSAWAALLLTGRLPGVGLDLDSIAAHLRTWGDNIYNANISAMQDEALDLMAKHDLDVNKGPS